MPGCGASTVSFGDGGEPGDGGDDGPGEDAGGEGGDGGAEAAACQPTCAQGTRTLVFLFTKYPQLQKVGGSALNNAPGYKDPQCGLSAVIVAQPTAGTYVAFSASCSHQCCTVQYSSSLKEFVCPCHGSTFATSGKVTGGPAPVAMTELQVCADACGVYVSY